MNNTSHKLEFHIKKENINNANDGNLIDTREKTRGNIFYLYPTIDTYLFKKVEDVWLWHKRLCHVNFGNMVENNRKKRLRGLPNPHKLKNVIVRVIKYFLTNSNCLS